MIFSFSGSQQSRILHLHLFLVLVLKTLLFVSRSSVIGDELPFLLFQLNGGYFHAYFCLGTLFEDLKWALQSLCLKHPVPIWLVISFVFVHQQLCYQSWVEVVQVSVTRLGSWNWSFSFHWWLNQHVNVKASACSQSLSLGFKNFEDAFQLLLVKSFFFDPKVVFLVLQKSPSSLASWGIKYSHWIFVHSKCLPLSWSNLSCWLSEACIYFLTSWSAFRTVPTQLSSAQ